MADHELRARIFAAIDGRKTARQVAEELGVDPRRVRVAAKSMGIAERLVPARDGKCNRAAALMDGRHTAQQIAEATGLALSSVYVLASKRGLSPALKRAAQEVPRDRMEAMLALPVPLADWLRRQCGAGVTMADVIRGILTDAFLDEVEVGDE